MTPEERLELVARAKELSSNPVFKGAVDSVKEEHMQALLSASPGSPEAVMHHSSLVAIEAVSKRITAVINDEMFLRKIGYL